MPRVLGDTGSCGRELAEEAKLDVRGGQFVAEEIITPFEFVVDITKMAGELVTALGRSRRTSSP